MYGFDYHRPDRLDDAAALLGGEGEPIALAGGQTLLPMLKLRLGQPTALVDLAGIEEMRGIRVEDDRVIVGAMTRHVEVSESPEVNTHIPALAALASGIGDPLVRNMGTLGGSLSYNHPGSDYPAAVLGLDAEIITSSRGIPADAFFQGMLDTALQPGELIVAVAFRVPARAGYIKFPSPATGYVLSGAFVAQTDAGVRVAINGTAPCAFRHERCEQALSENFTAGSVPDLELDLEELNSDLHGSGAYRAQLARVAVERAAEQALRVAS